MCSRDASLHRRVLVRTQPHKARRPPALNRIKPSSQRCLRRHIIPDTQLVWSPCRVLVAQRGAVPETCRDSPPHAPAAAPLAPVSEEHVCVANPGFTSDSELLEWKL